jgi:Tol biopolymer transport system component
MSRFDRLVLSTLFVLALLIGALAWRGDRVGATVVSVSPAPGATDVSTRATVRINFGQEMPAEASGTLISFNPPVSGTVRWEGKTLAFVPSASLAQQTTYTATLTAGLKSQQGRPVLAPPTWHFRTGQMRILYVGGGQPDRDQLMVVPLEGGQPVTLTQEPFGIWDYALSNDGTAIVYAAMRQDGGSDLMLMSPDGSGRKQLLACPQAACNGAAWFPDGRRLVYERHNLPAAGSSPGPGRLWWLDMNAGKTEPVFQDAQALGFGAHLSPDGQWLAYFSPSDQAVQVYSLNGSRNLMIPSQQGEPPVWSPQGDALGMNDIQFRGEHVAVHLYRADLDTNAITDLTGDEDVDDGSPAWSLDGQWIAFRRKSPAVAMTAHIWVMRRDGSQAHALTDDADFYDSAPAWSPDGRYLAFQRILLQGVYAQPEIWLIDVATGSLRQLAASGSRPTWLP